MYDSTMEQTALKVPGLGEANIELLNVNNYTTWRFRMKQYLTVKGLWEAIEDDDSGAGSVSAAPSGERTSGSAALSEKTKNEKDEEDKQAFALICLAVSEHHFPPLATVTSARVAWQTLESQFKEKNEARLLALQDELIHLRMDDDGDVTKYINKAKQLKAEMIQAGETESAINIVIPLLNGLPSRFAALRMAFVATKLPTVEELHSKLVNAEQHLRQMDNRSQPAVAAFSAARPERRDPKRMKCFYCDEVGHTVKNCEKLKEVKKSKPMAMSARIAF
jgi:hypothetical protein